MKFEGAALESMLHAETWAEDFADALTSFNTDATNRALLAYFTTIKKPTETITYAELSAVFLHLVDTGVLIREFPSDIANEQIAAMRQKFAPQTIPSRPPQPPNPNDYSEMTKQSFDNLSTEDSRRLYKTNPTFRARADHFWGGGK